MLACLLGLFLIAAWGAPSSGKPEGESGPQVIDLSLLNAPDLPCTWAAGNPPLQVNHYLRIGPNSPYNSDVISIDDHTGTQIDVPAHFIPPPDSKLPNAAPIGLVTADKVPVWQLVGEACVVDCRDLLDSAPNGRSDLIKKERLQAWEKKYRPLGAGDVVLFHAGFSDKYYKPFPAGRRFVADPLAGLSPGWPDPDPDCMEYLASRKVLNCGTDSPSMGPLPDLAVATHVAGLKHGMVWTEGAIGLGNLPATGAFYCMIYPKHHKGSAGEGRALAVVGEPLAKRLNEAARKKQVVDLSVTLAEELPVWWPGPGLGNHRHPYLSKVLHWFDQPGGPYYALTHTMDSHTGTHLVPPSYALPPGNFYNRNYSPQVQEWLAEYVKKYGPRGTSSVTTEKVPLAQTCGIARVVDVKHLRGTTDKKSWPASPEITVDELKKHEKEHGDLKAGEVVIFTCGWSDQYLKPFPEGTACMADPLNGKSEGWPALAPDAVMYLAEKGIRCVATDAPTLGSAEPRRALMTYWALGTKGMVGVEYLTNVGQIKSGAYFIFAPVKIRGCHGGPGRAIAVLI